jgi:hypothetical protein
MSECAGHCGAARGTTGMQEQCSRANKLAETNLQLVLLRVLEQFAYVSFGVCKCQRECCTACIIQVQAESNSRCCRPY